MRLRNQTQVDRLSDDFCRSLTKGEGNETFNWQGALDFLVASFPGSFGAILVQRETKRKPPILWSGSIDPQAIHAYCAHFTHVNPWIDLWKRLPSGSVKISEQFSPASQLKGKEFYEDWLRPLSNAEAYVGIKLNEPNSSLLLMAIHFDKRQTDSYNDLIAQVLTNAKTSLALAVHAERQFSKAYKSGSVDQVCRGSQDAIFVIDLKLRLHDTNVAGRHLIDRFHAKLVQGKLSICHKAVNKWLDAQLESARINSRSNDWRTVHQIDGRDMLFELVPLSMANVPGLFGLEELFVLRIMDLSRCKRSDFETISSHYRLTPSEARLCKLISSGLSLKQAATQLGNTESTARSTLKIIFDKTQTNRQSELIALCHRFPSAREV